MTNHSPKNMPQRRRAPRSCMSALAKLAVLAALVPGSAWLLAAPARATDSLTQTMQVSKEELATPEGRRAVEDRANAIAARLCRQFRDTRTVANRETYADCMRDAMAMVMTQVDTAAATAQAGSTAQPAASAQELAQRAAGN